MPLTNEDKLEASIAMCQGDMFRRGNVILFPLDSEYCVQKTIGPVSDKNRVITRSWSEALAAFERFTEKSCGAELCEYAADESPERTREIAATVYAHKETEM